MSAQLRPKFVDSLVLSPFLYFNGEAILLRTNAVWGNGAATSSARNYDRVLTAVSTHG
jgi:hypothetical protein